jgi:hypothetical protein
MTCPKWLKGFFDTYPKWGFFIVMSGKIVSEEYVKGWVIYSSIGLSKQRVVFEWGVGVKDSGKELSNRGNNNFKVTILVKIISKRTFDHHNSHFKKKKQRNKQCYE